MNWFVRRWLKRIGAVVIQSAEDPNTQYVEFKNEIRLIFEDGKYAGWYGVEA